MQSLGELLQAFGDESRRKQAMQTTRQILEEPIVREFAAEHPELTEEILVKHINRLYQYVKEYKACKNCVRLEECPNDLQGHYTKLDVMQIGDVCQIIDSKVPCSKLLTQQTQDHVRRRIRSFYVDNRALNGGYELEEILRVDQERAMAVQKIMEYIETALESGLQANGLYLYGKFGTGKTYLMSYMLHELAKHGFNGVIVYMPDFMEDLKSMFGEQGRLKETIELLKETDLLVFDDVGAENLSAWARDHVLGTILNYRMNRKPTFFTSNYDLDGLQRHFSFTSRDGEEAHKGMRIMDRIRPFVETVPVHGDNKRGKLL